MLEAAGKQRTIHQWGRSAAVALLLMTAGMVLVACASVPALSSAPPTWARAAATPSDEHTPSPTAAPPPTLWAAPLATTVPDSPLSQSLANLSGIRKAVVFSADARSIPSMHHLHRGCGSTALASRPWCCCPKTCLRSCGRKLRCVIPTVSARQVVHYARHIPARYLYTCQEAGGIPITVRDMYGPQATGSVLQTARVLAAALPFDDETLLVTGVCRRQHERGGLAAARLIPLLLHSGRGHDPARPALL
jgi:hypothetical protein